MGNQNLKPSLVPRTTTQNPMRYLLCTLFLDLTCFGFARPPGCFASLICSREISVGFLGRRNGALRSYCVPASTIWIGAATGGDCHGMHCQPLTLLDGVGPTFALDDVDYCVTSKEFACHSFHFVWPNLFLPPVWESYPWILRRHPGFVNKLSRVLRVHNPHSTPIIWLAVTSATFAVTNTIQT